MPPPSVPLGRRGVCRDGGGRFDAGWCGPCGHGPRPARRVRTLPRRHPGGGGHPEPPQGRPSGHPQVRRHCRPRHRTRGRTQRQSQSGQGPCRHAGGTAVRAPHPRGQRWRRGGARPHAHRARRQPDPCRRPGRPVGGRPRLWRILRGADRPQRGTGRPDRRAAGAWRAHEHAGRRPARQRRGPRGPGAQQHRGDRAQRPPDGAVAVGGGGGGGLRAGLGGGAQHQPAGA